MSYHRYLTVALLATLGLGMAVAQRTGASAFTYADRANNLQLQATELLGQQLQAGAIKLTVQGGVTLDSKAQGLRMTASRVEVDLVGSGGQARQNEIQRAVANGNVNLIKTMVAGGASRSTTLKGTRAEFTNRAADGLISMAGPVQLTDSDSAKRQTLSATASSLTATVDPTGAGRQSGLRNATLEGNVRVVLSQAAQQGQPASRMTATGAKMVLDNRSNPPTIVLTGNVRVEGDENSTFGVLQNVSRLELTLDEQGQVRRLRTGI
jgi:hypothetical protein